MSDDRALIARARAGDNDAFTQLLRDNDHNMRGVVWRLVDTPSAMDDVLQDAYLKAWRKLDGFRGDAAFSTWLYRIVHTTALDHLKAQTRRRTTSFDAMLDRDNANPANSSIDHQRDHASGVTDSLSLRQALAELPPDQLAVVALIDGEGRSYDHVAEVLEISQGTVGSRLHRARAALRERLQNPEGGRQ